MPENLRVWAPRAGRLTLHLTDDKREVPMVPLATVADGAGVVAAGVAVVGWFFGVNAQISSPMTTTAISATRPRRIQYTDGGCGPLPVSTSLMSQG